MTSRLAMGLTESRAGTEAAVRSASWEAGGARKGAECLTVSDLYPVTRGMRHRGVWRLLSLGRKLVEGRAGPRHARLHAPPGSSDWVKVSDYAGVRS